MGEGEEEREREAIVVPRNRGKRNRKTMVRGYKFSESKKKMSWESNIRHNDIENNRCRYVLQVH